MSVSLSTSSSSSDDDSIYNNYEFVDKNKKKLARMKIHNSNLSPENKKLNSDKKKELFSWKEETIL